MVVGAAFLGNYDPIDPEIVPPMHKIVYEPADAAQYNKDAEILRRYLRGLGITEEQIGTKTMFEWSNLKSEYWDRGKVPPREN